MEIKNSLKFDVKVTPKVDYEDPECRIAEGGAPDPVILRPGESLVLLDCFEPGTSFCFDSVLMTKEMIPKFRAAHDKVLIEHG